MKLVTLVAMCLVVPFTALAHNHETTAVGDKSIVRLAAENPQLSTLLKAVKAAGLFETLAVQGPWTVFAPANSAFERLRPGALEQLLADKGKLKQVLKYHVVPGKLQSEQLATATTLVTAEGSPLSVRIENDRVIVNNAVVTTANIRAGNGVIHLLDSVIMPKS